MLWREAPPPIPDHWFLSPPHSPGWWAPSRLCLYSFRAQTLWCIISTPLHLLSQHPCPSSLADQQAWHPFSFYIFLLKPGIRVTLNKSQITTPLWWAPTLAAPSSLLSKAALVPQPFISLDSLHTVLAPSDTLVSGGVRCFISRRERWPLTGTPPLPLSTLSLSTHPNSIPSSSSPHVSNKESLLLSEVNFSFFSSLPVSALSPCYASLPKVSRKISLSQKSDSIAFLFRIGQCSTLTLGQSPRQSHCLRSRVPPETHPGDAWHSSFTVLWSYLQRGHYHCRAARLTAEALTADTTSVPIPIWVSNAVLGAWLLLGSFWLGLSWPLNPLIAAPSFSVANTVSVSMSQSGCLITDLCLSLLLSSLLCFCWEKTLLSHVT